MKIVYDPVKRLSNLEKHGFDFADLDEAFFLEAKIAPANQGRWRATGEFGETIVTGIFSVLGAEAISIVSMRRASRKERQEL